MPTFKTKYKQLKDADVRYISLVDRAATRIPFRVLKREKENEMGIDLKRVFKSDDTAKPFLSALVVFAQKDEAMATKIRETIEKAGFATNVVQKSDEGETLVYAQTDQPGTTHVVRLGDQVLASVANLQVPGGWIGEMVEKNGFFPDLQLATEGLHEQMQLVAKSDKPQNDAKVALASYAQYIDQMMVLPTACFTLNDAINDIAGVQKGEVKPGETPAVNPAAESIKNETEEDRKKRLASHPPSEMAPVDEEDDQKPPPDEAFKSEILDVLQSMNGQLAGLATTVEAVATTQAEQKKVLDEVVKKTDTFDQTLKNTVTAPPVPEDRIAGNQMRVVKDDDPRRGNFDTAFLPGRGRRR